MRFLVLFKLDLCQTSFNQVENAFATQQLAILTTSIAFYHIVTKACAEILILRRESELRVQAFQFLEFLFRLPFFSFSFLFAAVIDLLLGLLTVKNLLRKHHQDWQILA